MVLLNLLTEERKKNTVRPYGEKQTITYQGVVLCSSRKEFYLANIDIEYCCGPP